MRIGAHKVGKYKPDVGNYIYNYSRHEYFAQRKT